MTNWQDMRKWHEQGLKAVCHAAKVLGITQDEAAKRLAIADFAAYCVGSCHGDWNPVVDETWKR